MTFSGGTELYTHTDPPYKIVSCEGLAEGVDIGNIPDLVVNKCRKLRTHKGK